MILLNEPYSIYERRLALERRRQTVRSAIGYWLLAMTGLAIAFTAGRILAFLGI